MLFRNHILTFIVLLLISDPAAAQQNPPKKDSTILYKNIETYSKRNKFTTFMYSLVFKPAAKKTKKKVVPSQALNNLLQKPYSNFEGKIIRKIEIVTLDPFGYSASDTTVAKQNFLYKAGNGMHIKTQGIAIRNLLLIRKNTPFSYLLVKESERLVRVQNYVQDVSFYVAMSAVNSDSVDIFIREKDKWSIIPYVSVSNNGMRLSITDRNIGGTGHEFHYSYSTDFSTAINNYAAYYTVPNIRNTYIRTTLHYELNSYGNFRRAVSVERPFYSAYTKWAGGIAFMSVSDKDTLKYINSVYAPQNLQFKAQDYWAGKAVRIFKGDSEDDRATNLILSARYLRIRYSEKPAEFFDPLGIYSNEDFYLGSIGISTRKYIQDTYIFKYGFTEDVPVGKVFGVTGGYQVRNGSGRFYLGTRVSFGGYYRFGYMSTNFEYGTFFNGSITEQGVLTGGINFFSGLLEAGRWKFRQFIKPQLTLGINRFPYDSLTLNDGYGIDGFRSPALSGTNRLTVTFQTQSYSPWTFAGFRFGPYVNYTFGILGNDETRFRNSKMYSQISIGVLIKNQNLVFTTFQISLSYYPMIPGIGENIFRMNSIRTTDFGFRDFVLGKPAPVVYE
jgi:hypothetical protein